MNYYQENSCTTYVFMRIIEFFHKNHKFYNCGALENIKCYTFKHGTNIGQILDLVQKRHPFISIKLVVSKTTETPEFITPFSVMLHLWQIKKISTT